MRVLLLDDHPLILDALTHVLRQLVPDIEVCATDCPDEAFAALQDPPGVDLALLDLKLGEGVDGFAVLDRMRQDHPEVPVTVVSGTDRLADVVRVVDSGAMGFIPKRSSRDEMYRALGMVVSGGVYLPQALLDLIARIQGRHDLGETTIGAAVAQLAAADALAAASANPGLSNGAAAQAPAGLSASSGSSVASSLPLGGLPLNGMPVLDTLATLGLTPRQTEVLKLLLRALPNKLIARELNLSVETVKDHVAAVLRALGVTSRTQAVLAVGRLNAQAMAQQQAGRTPPPAA